MISNKSLPRFDDIKWIKYGWSMLKKIVTKLSINELTLDIFKKIKKLMKNKTKNISKIIYIIRAMVKCTEELTDFGQMNEITVKTEKILPNKESFGHKIWSKGKKDIIHCWTNIIVENISDKKRYDGDIV